MQKPDGSKAVKDKENAQVFCEHFSKIFNNQSPLPCDHSALNLIYQHSNFTHLADLPTVSEVCSALYHMANRKALGPSGIASNALKYDLENDNANYLATVIHAMILEFWEGTLDFESWRSGALTPVPKKGDLSNPNKWHPFCLLETTYKTLACIFARRINPLIQDHGLELQYDSLNLK
eukprot:4197590-Ditylum_brightwellii.AAC.1